MPQMCYYINVAARNADVAQSVERILGKDEVTSSNLVISSINPVSNDWVFALLGKIGFQSIDVGIGTRMGRKGSVISLTVSPDIYAKIEINFIQ